MIGAKIDQSSSFDRYTWVKFNAETGRAQCFYSKLLKTVASKNGEFRAGNVRNWRKCIERANLHQESTDHKRCFKDAISLLLMHYAKASSDY